MANTGDFYEVELKKTHIKWGTYRYTETRASIEGEGYIPIPKSYAEKYTLLNSKGTHGEDVYGKNLFNCVSADGLFHGVLRAQGNTGAGEPFAKQFSGDHDLRAIGTWYSQVGAHEGTIIRVEWVTPKDIVISVVR